MIEDVVVTASKKPQWRVQPTISKPKGRQRVWHSKARTGCLTCKRRKVRCDEGKPTCSRCRKAKIGCEGYAPLKTWLFERSDGSSTSSPSVSGISTDQEGRLVRNASPSGDELTKFETRALQFFQEKTAPILSTFAPSATHFWCNIVPHLSLSNEIVRSSLIAISSLHESKHYRQIQEASPVADRVFAEHYTKTVSALTNPGRPPPPEVILITCFIFIACENIKLIGSAPAELMHVRSGLRVLREWKANNKRHGLITADSMHDVMQNLLEPMFARLEAQMFIMLEPKVSHAFFREYDLNWIEPVIPTSFPDLFAARDSINDSMQWLWYNTQVAGGPLFANTLAFKSVNGLMKQWSQTFKSSFPLLQDRNWPAWKAAAALQIHWTALQIGLQAEALDSILYWDLCHDQVEWMLETCEEIICSEGPVSSTTDTSPSLWLYDFCLNPPLLLIANNCRHPDLRRQSVELMRKQHEWLYQSEDDGSYCWTAFACDVIISLEESRTDTTLSPKPGITTAEAVLETSRIRPMQIIMAVPGQATVRYMRSPFVEMQEYTVAWDKWTKPAIDQVTMWPFGEQVKHGNYQGLIRPLRRKCLCRSFGAPVADAWTVPP